MDTGTLSRDARRVSNVSDAECAQGDQFAGEAASAFLSEGEILLL
jgi:hypothetical protein